MFATSLEIVGTQDDSCASVGSKLSVVSVGSLRGTVYYKYASAHPIRIRRRRSRPGPLTKAKIPNVPDVQHDGDTGVRPQSGLPRPTSELYVISAQLSGENVKREDVLLTDACTRFSHVRCSKLTAAFHP